MKTILLGCLALGLFGWMILGHSAIPLFLLVGWGVLEIWRKGSALEREKWQKQQEEYDERLRRKVQGEAAGVKLSKMWTEDRERQLRRN